MFVYKGSSFHFYTLSVSELAHYFFALSVLKCHSNLSTKRKYQCHKLLKHGKKGNSLLLPRKTFSLLECKRKNVYASKVFCERSLFYLLFNKSGSFFNQIVPTSLGKGFVIFHFNFALKRLKRSVLYLLFSMLIDGKQLLIDFFSFNRQKTK